MPVSEKYKAPFYCENYYHFIFKSIDDILLFRQEENHEFFLRRFSFFLQPVLHCYAYCLLQNHAHFIVHIKNREDMLKNFTLFPEDKKTTAIRSFIANPVNDQLIDALIERLVNSFMISYVNALNKSLSRKGSLFQSPFRRVEITDDAHLQQAIIYTHANAQKHNLINDFRNYPYSSWHEMITGNGKYIAVNKVLNFFGGRDPFIEQHASQVAYFYE